MGDILVINAGSSSIKLAIINSSGEKRLTGSITGIGDLDRGHINIGGEDQSQKIETHADALSLLLASLSSQGINIDDLKAAAHRVVHGGTVLTKPSMVTEDVIKGIKACIPLAPLHNPHNLLPILALRELAPGLPQMVSVDTAFHATNPDLARQFAIPKSLRDQGYQRYGFHGISYGSLVARFSERTERPLPKRLLALHLGNGCSLCAIRNGQSVATTMGYSPIDGLTMGTRAGAMDANAVLDMARQEGIERTSQILNHESGLLALAGTMDMRTISGRDDPDAAFALDHFCYWVIRQSGAMMAAMGGVDALAFTGGIGENAANIRASILKGLSWAGLNYSEDANSANATTLHTPQSSIAAWIVPAGEEQAIAYDAMALLETDCVLV